MESPQQRAKILEAYNSHIDKEQSTFFHFRLSTDDMEVEDSLMLPPGDCDALQPLQCPNSLLNNLECKWRRLPNDMSNKPFPQRVGRLCLAARLYECDREQCLEMKAKMEHSAPPCTWKNFREWALTAMSCQQSFSFDAKQLVAHTHLVNAVYGCCKLVQELSEDRLPEEDRFDLHTYFETKGLRPERTRIDLAGVRNVIFWMLTIQQENGFTPKLVGIRTWDNHFLSRDVILPEVRKALMELQTMHICKNRLWNLVDLSDQRQFDLPAVVDALRSHPSISHDDKHKLCTQTKCQRANINSEGMTQLCKCTQKPCPQTTLDLDHYLIPAVNRKERTAWLMDKSGLVGANQSYIAISHVWSDRTGAGKTPGTLKNCLFEYFARVTKVIDSTCEGIWWDTISIPRDSDAKNNALNVMHTNYSNAKYTIVHDLFLLDQQWTSKESACLALVLSPWFTRGWTALELAMSINEVKVLFKGPDPNTPDIRDLQNDLLADGPGTSSRAHWLATCLIKRLRKPIENLSDLLAILRPRSTSWIRDRTIISALLARVPNLNSKLSESEITQDILKHLGSLPHTSLLHGRPTMTDFDGFSWCPAILDELPIDTRRDGVNEDHILDIHPDGSITGYWYARAVSGTDIRLQRLRPDKSDVSGVVKIETTLQLAWEKCLILYPSIDSKGPALLVTAIESSTGGDDELFLDCRYVGTIRDSWTRWRCGIPPFDWTHSSINKFGNYDYYKKDRDDNIFLRIQIRLGRDAGKEGEDAFDLLTKAFTQNWKHANRYANEGDKLDPY